MAARRFAAVVLSTLALAACDPHTFSIRFEPEVDDRYRFRSEITANVERTVDGVTTVEASDSVLDAIERVVAIDEDEVRVAVTLERDGATSRSYDVRFDRGDRLTAIDLIEGVPAETLGLELANDLPADVASPPAGPLEPGERWTIDREVTIESSDAIRVRGEGRIDALGVIDGNDVAIVIVDIEVPIENTFDTPDGRVTVRGVQRSTSRTTYDLADGAARLDETTIQGDLDVTVQPPGGVQADPVEGAISYAISTETRRVPDDS